MRKAPFAILACVVLFLSVVVGVLLSRQRAPRPEPPQAAPSRADYRIKEVHLQEEGRGGSRWSLDAEQAEVFEEQGRTLMRKVTVRLEQARRGWTVTGDEGILLQQSKDVELRGDVVLVSSDGLRVETSRLYWDASAQRAWTDRPVTIYRPGAVVRGQGFESRLAEEATAVKGRLRAVFGKTRATPGGRGS